MTFPGRKQTLTLPSRSPAQGRIFELDFVRGCLMLLLIIYHLVYTLASTSQFFHYVGEGAEPSWVLSSTSFFHAIWYSEPLLILQLVFSSFFFFLCGISCGFSKHNAKRGYELLFLGVLESMFLVIVSYYAHIEAHVYIGLLHALGISILIYALVDHFFKSYWADLAFGLLFIALFAIFYNHSMVYDLYGNPTNPVYYTSQEEATAHLWELFNGYATAGIDSWSPIRLSAFIFLGAATSKLLYKNKESLWRPRKTRWAAPINFMGRHSLILYLAEQVVILAIMWCVLAPFGYTF